MRVEIHLDDAPEFGTEAVRKAVGVSRQDDPKTRAVIYYEQPESVVEVSAEVFDPEFGQFISVLTVPIPVHALRAALRAVEDNSPGEVEP